MLAACMENGVIPMVTFYHFSSPRWFAAMGGWKKPPAADLFVRYCERAAPSPGDLIGFASTFNEPNLPMLLRWVTHIDVPFTTALLMGKRAARAVGAGHFGCFFLGNPEKLQVAMIAAHLRALNAMKSGPGSYPVGVNVAIQDEQAVGLNSKRDRKRAQVYDPWLAAADRSDFLGIQTYARARIGKEWRLGAGAWRRTHSDGI